MQVDSEGELQVEKAQKACALGGCMHCNALQMC